MMSSVMPSEKYSCSESPLMFAKGKTAIEGLSGSGNTVEGDHQGAARELRIAIQLDSNLYEAHYYLGTMALQTGKFEEGVSHMRRALEIGGNDLQSAMMVLTAYRGTGRKDDLKDSALRALTIAERRLELNPVDERAHYVGAMALIELGDLHRAKEWARMAAAVDSVDPRTGLRSGSCFIHSIFKCEPPSWMDRSR